MPGTEVITFKNEGRDWYPCDSYSYEVVLEATRGRPMGYPIQYRLFEHPSQGWLIGRSWGWSEVFASVKDETEGRRVMAGLASGEIEEDYPDLG